MCAVLHNEACAQQYNLIASFVLERNFMDFMTVVNIMEILFFPPNLSRHTGNFYETLS